MIFSKRLQEVNLSIIIIIITIITIITIVIIVSCGTPAELWAPPQNCPGLRLPEELSQEGPRRCRPHPGLGWPMPRGVAACQTKHAFLRATPAGNPGGPLKLLLCSGPE